MHPIRREHTAEGHVAGDAPARDTGAGAAALYRRRADGAGQAVPGATPRIFTSAARHEAQRMSTTVQRPASSGWRTFFLLAALYDLILGAVFLFASEPILTAIGMTLPPHIAYIQLAAV